MIIIIKYKKYNLYLTSSCIDINKNLIYFNIMNRILNK